MRNFYIGKDRMGYFISEKRPKWNNEIRQFEILKGVTHELWGDDIFMEITGISLKNNQYKKFKLVEVK
jgi:hypothetical protein